MSEDYDYHLGLTDEERSRTEPLFRAGRLSHYVEFDDDNYTVETWGHDLETGDRLITRRRPMSQVERDMVDCKKEGRVWTPLPFKGGAKINAKVADRSLWRRVVRRCSWGRI